MKRRSFMSVLAGTLVPVALFLTLPVTADARDTPPGAPTDINSTEFAEYVLTRVDDQYRGQKSHGFMKMEVKTKHWTRTIRLEAWSLGEEYSIVRILSPKKEKGTATLKAKDNLFTYLNKTGRTIKIGAGMMGGSWMGSHFNNNDLVQGSRLSDDFTFKKTFSGKDGGVEVHRFTLMPRPDAPVIWGKVVVTVRQSDLLPVSQAFYDEDMKKVRELTFGDYREVGGAKRPMKMEMRPLNKKGEYTRVVWEDLDFGVALDKSFFSLQKLKSMR